MRTNTGPTSKKRSRLFAGAIALLLGAIAAGCAMSSEGSALPGDKSIGPNGGAGADPGGNYQVGGNTDGGEAAKLELGNPLCRATTLSCYPDGTGNRRCEGDAGSPSSGDDGGVRIAEVGACRLREGFNLPVCTQAGAGTDDAACAKSSDCAAGYECIAETPSPYGTCRHYCCGGASACADPRKAPASRFCDLQRTKESGLAVPVCMPIRSCELLQNNPQCGAGESCTIVNDEGAVSCVRTGDAQVGQSCETVHCGSGLACLGQTGSRTCYQLCKKKSLDNFCAPGETCKGSAPRFQDPEIGICSKV